MDSNLEKGDTDKADITQVEDVSPSTASDEVPTERKNAYAVKGDESDGKVVWNLKTRIAAFSLVLLYVGSQIPLYFVGGTLQFITASIGNASTIGWLPVAYTLAVAATCPFSGYLQDLMGRRYIALMGCALLCVGAALLGTTHTIGQGVTGMALAGAGAGIGELTALAGVSEIVPVNKRGIFLGVVTAGIVPFCPYVMYGQYFSRYAPSGWRWGMWITIITNGIAGIGALFTYFPQRVRPDGETKMDILKKIDYVGGAISITGLTLFLVALQAGGYTHSWKSAYVLCTLIFGLLLIGVFIAWEAKFAKLPMVPREIFAGQKIVGLAFGIAFISGMNFYSMLNFFPITYEDMYNPTPFGIGIKALPPALGVTLGAVLVNSLLSVWKNWNRELLLGCCVLMTVFIGALGKCTPDTPAQTVIFGTIGGFGVGGVLVPAATIAITVTPDAFIATTVALSLAIRVIGGSIGYSIYYNVFAEKLAAKLPAYVAQFAIEAGLPITSVKEFVTIILVEGGVGLQNVAGVTPAVIEAATMASRWAYGDSLKYVWYTSIAFGALSCVACCFLGNVRPYLTHRVAVELKQ